MDREGTWAASEGPLRGRGERRWKTKFGCYQREEQIQREQKKKGWQRVFIDRVCDDQNNNKIIVTDTSIQYGTPILT